MNDNSFFTQNKPRFSTEQICRLSEGYIGHFRGGNTHELSTWLKSELSRIGLGIDSTSIDTAVPTLVARAKTDVEQALSTDPSLGENGAQTVIGHYPGFEAITLQRLAHFLYEQNVSELPRALTELVHRKTGIDIHPGAQIGTHFFIDHGTGIVIGETAKIGNNVVLYHGVTLGNRSEPKPGQSGTKRHPTLQDNVTVFANASVLGGDTVVGEGAKIGTGAIVLGNVSPKFTVHSGTVYRGKEQEEII